MARFKHYLDIDVVEAARQRLRHVYETFDTCVVCFSGGKDSLVLLHLAHEIAQEFGQEKLLVSFRDEEIIPQSVIDFVDKYRQEPWIDMHWYAMPQINTKYILGKTIDCVLWDPNRRWLREKPPWADTLGDTTKVYGAEDVDLLQAERGRGRVALLTGVRASESLVRYRSCVEKLNENYICASTQPHVKMVKPVYDFEEDDVFKFLGESGIPWCPHYDAQHLVPGSGLRVSPPTHAQAAKKMDLMKFIDPEWYQRLMDTFPELQVQERYYREYDRESLSKEYGDSWDGIKRWIDEHLTDKDHRKASARFRKIKIRAHNSPDSYPVDKVLKYFAAGSYRQEFIPIKKGGS